MSGSSAGQDAPAWFTRAMATPGESRTVDVLRCPIHYLRWGDPTRPGLLFVPASGAHAHWYDHLGPLFADQFNVVAIDLAGCGDSGRRPDYTIEQIKAEIMGVAADAGMLDAAVPPTLVGHSAGAQHVVRLALDAGEQLLGVIAVEGLRYAELEKDHALKFFANGPRPPAAPAKVRPSFEEAVSRFRLTPEPLAPVGHRYILDHIARHSVREVEGGWTSKYDTAQVAPVTLAFELKDKLKDLKCRAAAVYGEHSHITDETVCDAMSGLNDGKVPVFVIPGATHYPPLDSPIAFLAAVKGLATAWLAERRRADPPPP